MANARLTSGMAVRRTGGWDAVLAAFVSGLVLCSVRLYLDRAAAGRDDCCLAARPRGPPDALAYGEQDSWD